jgi:dolichol-phosphate mannosyltransferase
MRLSIVIPCFNEQASLEELHRRVSAAAVDAVGISYELILVNDGSTDRTWEQIRALLARDARCVGVDLSRRHGQQLALAAGLDVCAGDRVLILDADLQDPPELLGEMMRLMDGGADVVYGERIARPGDGVFKQLSAKWFYRLLGRIAEVRIPADAGDFRLINARVLQVLKEMPEQHRFLRAMVSWAGFRQVPIRYTRSPRQRGSSSYSVSGMMRLALDAITAFSVRPLRLAAYAGIVSALAGVGSALLIFTRWLSGAESQGWAVVMTVILVLGGVQLITIGILGEYLGRLSMQAKHRPLYIVKEVVRAAARAAHRPAEEPLGRIEKRSAL